MFKLNIKKNMQKGVLNYISSTITNKKIPDIFSKNNDITKTRMSSKSYYHSSHPRQIQLSQAIVVNLITDLGLPLTTVERESFINFMNLVDSKFIITSRRTSCRL